jgi:hypothetical protein
MDSSGHAVDGGDPKKAGILGTLGILTLGVTKHERDGTPLGSDW